MTFEWDESKAASNLTKHRVSFVAARNVFTDERHIIEDVTKPEYGEARFKAIGLVDDVLLVTVIYTDRDERIRIISARRANKREQRKYYSSDQRP